MMTVEDGLAYLQVIALSSCHAEEATHGIARLLHVRRGEGGVVAAGGQVVGGGIEGRGRAGGRKVVRAGGMGDAIPITTFEEL